MLRAPTILLCTRGGQKRGRAASVPSSSRESTLQHISLICEHQRGEKAGTHVHHPRCPKRRPLFQSLALSNGYWEKPGTHVQHPRLLLSILSIRERKNRRCTFSISTYYSASEGAKSGDTRSASPLGSKEAKRRGLPDTWQGFDVVVMQ